MNSGEGITTLVPNPTELSDTAVARLNRAGEREKWSDLQIVDECRAALEIMPVGKIGVVLGSGPRTEYWKSRGWYTLDIDPKSDADVIWNANELESVTQPESLDYVYAECITMHPSGKNGVGHSRLLQQANAVLKPGGMLIIATAHGENLPGEFVNNLPNRHTYPNMMRRHGFRSVAVLGPISPINGSARSYEQPITYYGKKIRAGFE